MEATFILLKTKYDTYQWVWVKGKNTYPMGIFGNLSRGIDIIPQLYARTSLGESVARRIDVSDPIVSLDWARENAEVVIDGATYERHAEDPTALEAQIRELLQDHGKIPKEFKFDLVDNSDGDPCAAGGHGLHSCRIRPWENAGGYRLHMCDKDDTGDIYAVHLDVTYPEMAALALAVAGLDIDGYDPGASKIEIGSDEDMDAIGVCKVWIKDSEVLKRDISFTLPVQTLRCAIATWYAARCGFEVTNNNN